MEGIIFLGLSLYAWITIVTVLGMFAVLIFTKVPAEAAFLGAIAILLVTGVLETKEALAGFSSSSVVVIGALFIVIAGLVHTGVLQWITKHLLGTPGSYPKAIVRLMVPVAVLSSFLNKEIAIPGDEKLYRAELSKRMKDSHLRLSAMDSISGILSSYDDNISTGYNNSIKKQ